MVQRIGLKVSAASLAAHPQNDYRSEQLHSAESANMHIVIYTRLLEMIDTGIQRGY